MKSESESESERARVSESGRAPRQWNSPAPPCDRLRRAGQAASIKHSQISLQLISCFHIQPSLSPSLRDKSVKASV